MKILKVLLFPQRGSSNGKVVFVSGFVEGKEEEREGKITTMFT